MPRKTIVAILAASLQALVPVAAIAQTPATSTVVNTGVEILAADANATGSLVSVTVRWDKGLIALAGKSDRFVLALTALEPYGSPLTLRRRVTASAANLTEKVSWALSDSQAAQLRGAHRVVVTATQSYDSPSDSDTKFELNDIAVRHVHGTIDSAAGRSCTATLRADVNASSCDLRGADLTNADLRKVNLAYANLTGARLVRSNLTTTNLTGTRLDGATLNGALMASGEQGALTLPDDGAKIVAAIDGAQSSVDIVIYDFGGPNIVGQAFNPGALMRAVARGVNVRVILNSATEDELCKGLDTAAQAICGWTESLDPLYATQASLKYAQVHPESGKTAGKVRVQFSSQNFQITHQKTILIDTATADGTPRTATQMTSNSKALVSTGNLQAFPVDWGRRANCAKSHYDQFDNYVCDQYQVLNKDYLTNPAASCGGSKAPMTGKTADCATEWQARDFTIVVQDPPLLERIAMVYGSDQRCDPRTVNNKLISSVMPDTWANGTLLSDNSQQYPLMNTDAFYGGGPNTALEINPQGNSRKRQLALIAQAEQTLIVYNEEMDDLEIVGALSRAASPPRNVDVRVVMATKVDYKTKKPDANHSFDTLVISGVKIHLIPSSPPIPSNREWVYIHAKAIVADGKDAFMGSENFGYASMNFNRELGLMLTNRTDPSTAPIPSALSVGGISQITSRFENDWKYPGVLTYVNQNAPLPPPPSKAYGGFSMACDATATGGDLYAAELPVRALPPIRPDQPVQ